MTGPGSSIRGIAFVVALVVSLNAVGAKLHVATWGNDADPCGSTVQPCRTIGKAESVSVKNGKIVVQPGIYRENVEINVEGLKLESEAGRYGTFIEADNAADHVLEIRASKVKIGSKGKGFSISGANANTTVAGIFVSSGSYTGIRIEHNRLMGNNYGMNLRGEKLQVRSNAVIDTSDASGTPGTGSIGIYCVGCVKPVIQDNFISLTGAFGIYLSASSNIALYRNRTYKTRFDGIYLFSNSSFVKLKDNVFEASPAQGGLYLGNAVGALVQGNISVKNGDLVNDSGFDIRQEEPEKPFSIKNNLALANFGQGFTIGTHPDSSAKFDSNSAIGNGGVGVQVLSAANLVSFKNNNTYDSASGDGVGNASGDIISYKRQFFGGPDGPDDTSGDGDGVDYVDPANMSGTFVTKPNPFKAKKAAKLP